MVYLIERKVTEFASCFLTNFLHTGQFINVSLYGVTLSSSSMHNVGISISFSERFSFARFLDTWIDIRVSYCRIRFEDISKLIFVDASLPWDGNAAREVSIPRCKARS